MNWEEKCWGRVSHISTDDALVSLLKVEEGGYCSIHRHLHRFNSFRVISGSIVILEYRLPSIEVPIRKKILVPGDSYTVPPGQWHSFEVLQSGTVVEVYWTADGTLVSIEDIVRIREGGRRAAQE